ncbi:hypothetical protein ACP275_08G249100 [Erythranthe tilingii]
MCNLNKKKNIQTISLFLITFNLFIFKSFSFCYIMPDFEVHIVNNLPKNSAPLRLHCASKDTDFGVHVASPNQEFYWKFCINFWATTMYFCHFWWGRQETSFEVFNTDYYSSNCVAKDKLLETCQWSVREDGFYFGNKLREEWP